MGHMSDRAREVFVRAALFSLSTLFVLIVGELFFRTALFSDYLSVEQLRQPWRYADSLSDDDYWRLTSLFAAERGAQEVGRIDSKLGWAPQKTASNPLGLVSDTPYIVKDLKHPILFYGDSFVAGATPVKYCIPQMLDRMVPNRPVPNYGVGGYGVDQIYLRFSQTVSKFDNPLVLIGILTRDLDRCVLAMRTGQKPYFEIQGGALVVRNTPISPTTEAYLESNPPRIRSYFLRFVCFRLRRLLPASWFDALFGYDAQHQRKLIINRRILRAFREDSEALGVPLYMVLFYGSEDFSKVTWREKFLKSTLEELGLDYFDTKPYLLHYIKHDGVSLNDLYYARNGHPNEEGNHVIAEGLYEWLHLRRALSMY